MGGGFKSINVTLRKEFELFANLRPARTLIPGGRYDHIDIVLVRENLEGFYAAMEHYVPIGHDTKAIAMSTGFNTRTECRRIIHYAFDYAVRNGRKKVTLVHKANILKALTGLFLEEGRLIAKEYEGRIEMNDRIVDACAMQLVLDPWQYDVIVTTNLFGGHPVGPDRRPGRRPRHGAGRPTSATRRRSSRRCTDRHPTSPARASPTPLAMLLSTGLMLQHVGRNDLATRLTHRHRPHAGGWAADLGILAAARGRGTLPRRWCSSSVRHGTDQGLCPPGPQQGRSLCNPFVRILRA